MHQLLQHENHAIIEQRVAQRIAKTKVISRRISRNVGRSSEGFYSPTETCATALVSVRQA